MQAASQVTKDGALKINSSSYFRATVLGSTVQCGREVDRGPERREEKTNPRAHPKYMTQNERNKANSQKVAFLFVFICFTLVCQGDEIRTSVSH